MKPSNHVRFLIALAAAAVVTGLFPAAARALPKYATAEGKSCAYCHLKPSGGGARNYRGAFYQKNNHTFGGFDDAAEAKKAGVEIGPEAAPPPKSFKPANAPVSAAPGTNLLKPLSDTMAWRLQQSGGGAATQAIEADALKVTVTAVGTTRGSVQVLHLLSSLNNGENYTVRFRARADAPRPIRVLARTNIPMNFRPIGLQETVNLTTDWQTFEYKFTVKGADVMGNRALVFQFGMKTGTVWIGDVSLVKAGTAAAGTVAPVKTEPKPAGPALPPDTANPAAVPDFGEATFNGIAFVKIPAGTFIRGTTDEQRKVLESNGTWTPLNAEEQPARQIRITRPFFLSKYEVSQAEWTRFMGDDPKLHPSSFKYPKLPVETVSWNEVQGFLTKLGEASGGKGRYRLPTEAEWEYAARAGSSGVFGMGADKVAITPERLGEYAWYAANAQNKTQPVGTKKSNAWGLHDMHGSVWEWCQDGYSPDFYASSPDADPLYTGPATERVLRGGCWFLDARALRAALRGGSLPDVKSQYVGFRLVREL